MRGKLALDFTAFGTINWKWETFKFQWFGGMGEGRVECWTLRMANCYSKRKRHLHPRGQTQSRLMPNYNTYSSESALHRMHIVSRNILVEYFLYIMLLFHFLSVSLSFLFSFALGGRTKSNLDNTKQIVRRWIFTLDSHFEHTLLCQQIVFFIWHRIDYFIKSLKDSLDPFCKIVRFNSIYSLHCTN